MRQPVDEAVALSTATDHAYGVTPLRTGPAGVQL